MDSRKERHAGLEENFAVLSCFSLSNNRPNIALETGFWLCSFEKSKR